MSRKKFSPWSKPLAPDKPKEFISSSEPILTFDIEPYCSLAITEEMRSALLNADFVGIDDLAWTYSDSVENVKISFRSTTERLNPRYEEQLVAYKEEYTAYKEELAWWKAEKAKYDAKEAKKKEAAERRQLERLQKKYGTEP